MSMKQLPAWNNNTEYQSLTSDDFNADYEKLEALIRQIAGLGASKTFDVPTLQQISSLYDQAVVIFRNLQTDVGCEQSLDAKNETAIKLNSRLSRTGAALAAATTSSQLFLCRCEDKILSEYLKSPETEPQSFFWREERKQK